MITQITRVPHTDQTRIGMVIIMMCWMTACSSPYETSDEEWACYANALAAIKYGEATVARWKADGLNPDTENADVLADLNVISILEGNLSSVSDLQMRFQQRYTQSKDAPPASVNRLAEQNHEHFENERVPSNSFTSINQTQIILGDAEFCLMESLGDLR